jgi:hypothetical protein
MIARYGHFATAYLGREQLRQCLHANDLNVYPWFFRACLHGL